MKTASVGICLQRMIGEGRKEESEALNRKFLICRVQGPLAVEWSAQWCSDTAQWGVQFISGQIRKQETPIMNHIDDNDATMQQQTNIPLW